MVYSISALIRIEVGTSGLYIFSDSSGDAYCRLVTAHGLGMVFLFIMPALISAMGNWLVPQSYGALDFATPRLNNIAFWTSVTAAQLIVISISTEDGLAAGWTLYFPLTGLDFSSSSAVSVAILALHVLGLSSESGAITFLVSLTLARSSGVSTQSWDLIVWCIWAVSILLITTLPILGAGITLLFLERHANFGVLAGQGSGDPVIFQHLFWFFGHPEVYIIILPAFGIVSWHLIMLTNRVILSHIGMILAIWAICLVGYFVWAHHMFTTGMGDLTRLYFSIATMVIGIPTAVKIFAWSACLTESVFRDFTTVLTTAFLACFLFGGFTGLLLANAALDLAYHDTYFVVGHFHYVLSIAATIAVNMLLISFGQAVLLTRVRHQSIILAITIGVWGVNTLFLLQHLLGIEGHPRRVFFVPEIYTTYAELSNGGLLMICIGLAMFNSSWQAGQVSSSRWTYTTLSIR